MNTKHISDKFSVTGQLSEKDFEDIAKSGYKHVVNCRPDGEAEDQPSSIELSTAAASAGLQLVHIPISGSTITPDDVIQFSNVVDSANAPVLGFCRSGMRAAMLWALWESNRTEADSIISIVTQHGYDLSTNFKQLLTKQTLVRNL